MVYDTYLFKKLKKRIESLSIADQGEIFFVLHKTNTSYTQNRNGVFVNMKTIPRSVLDGIDQIVNKQTRGIDVSGNVVEIPFRNNDHDHDHTSKHSGSSCQKHIPRVHIHACRNLTVGNGNGNGCGSSCGNGCGSGSAVNSNSNTCETCSGTIRVGTHIPHVKSITNTFDELFPSTNEVVIKMSNENKDFVKEFVYQINEHKSKLAKKTHKSKFNSAIKRYSRNNNCDTDMFPQRMDEDAVYVQDMAKEEYIL